MSQSVEAVIHELTGEVKEFAEIAKSRIEAQEDRVRSLEMKLSRPAAAGAWNDAPEKKSAGAQVVESEQFQRFAKDQLRHTGKIGVGAFNLKAAILSDGSLYTQPHRVPGIVATYQRLGIRDILRTSPTTSNLVEYVREKSDGTTNAAAPQGKGTSPFTPENVAKAESSMAFELLNEPVQTVAHWIPASRQVLDDSAALRSFVDGRMLHFLKVEEEDQLLNGTGAGGDLSGLITQATAYDTGDNESGDTPLDTLRRAIAQVEDPGYSVNAIVLSSGDWARIQLLKTATEKAFLFADPHVIGQPAVWGRPVIISSAMSAGDFLVGDFQVGAELFDRQQSSVEISREHSDFFVKNMVAVLAEERLALVTYQPDAFRYGSFPAAS